MVVTALFIHKVFANENKIMQRLKDLFISRNTVKDWFLKIPEYITNQQKTNFK